MSGMDWVSIAFGILLIAMGIAFAASRRFGEIAYEYTAQGEIWKKLAGEKWAPLIAKYFFSLVSIVFGVWIIYSVISGYN